MLYLMTNVNVVDLEGEDRDAPQHFWLQVSISAEQNGFIGF